MTAIDQGKNIKAVFFDIDGTLLSHKTGEVPQSTIDAIEEIRSRGILAIVATGRHMSEYEGLPVAKIKFDGYLMLNGQLLHDSDRKVYSGTAIDPGEMEILARIFSAKKIPFILIGENQRYINYVNDTVVETQSQTQGTIPSIEEYKGEKVYQICAFVPENQKILLDNLLDECHVSSWHESGIDIIPKGGGKGSGVKAFVEENGLDRSETMAFGDSQNDKGMIEYAGIGVAMGNAIDELKEVADYVTDSVDDDGIAKALRHFGLIG